MPYMLKNQHDYLAMEYCGKILMIVLSQ